MAALRVYKSNIDTIIIELKEKGEIVPIISDSIFKSLFREEEILLEANSKSDTYTRFRHSYGEVVNKVKVASKPEDIGFLFLINFDNENSNAKRLVSRIVMKDDDNEEDHDQIFFQKYRVSIPFVRKKKSII